MDKIKLKKNKISIVIPTFQREKVLIDTINYLLQLSYKANEIIIIDQTKQHKITTEKSLQQFHAQGDIYWIRLKKPSIPAAMNQGLLKAKEDIVLFLDDDIRPEDDLIKQHQRTHNTINSTIVAGRVIQPWQENKIFSQDKHFHFASLKPFYIKTFMGGNFSIKRNIALKIGGFDENFIKVAYRFEAEFSYRITQLKGIIYYQPKACIHHLKVIDGGTRSFGKHLTTFLPNHSVGAYYYHLRTWQDWKSLKNISSRLLFSIITKHHLKHPWWIPATLISEISGIILALFLFIKKPKYIKPIIKCLK